jgi:hypothetical protein
MRWTGTTGRSAPGTYQASFFFSLASSAITGVSLLTSFSPLPIYVRYCSRRICPGIHIAERELWFAISRLLWAFDIRPLPDEPISLEEYEGESGRTPLPYRITLTPRHNRVQTLLEAEQEVTLMKY